MVIKSEVIYTAFFILCIIGTQGKPTFSFKFPALELFSGFVSARAQREVNTKEYSGRRIKNDSLIMVYVHDQTVAITELGPKKLLISCELIEVNEPDEAAQALRELKEMRPVYISLMEMLTLMSQCEQVDRRIQLSSTSVHHQTSSMENKGILSNNPLTLFSGIIPGTKWCGTGDIANDYFDLGAEPNVDRCCRAHDLCPVKVRAYSQRYNLTNNSLYTKSHCQCDDNLFDCLKSSHSQTAHIMGNVYFNLIQVPCVEDKDNKRNFRKAKNNF